MGRGRKPKGERALTPAERKRKSRAAKKAGAVLVIKSEAKTASVLIKSIDHARAVGKAMRDLPVMPKDPEPRGPACCPRCGALYALVGHVHRCRGGER